MGWDYDRDYWPPSRPLPADGIKAKGTGGQTWWAKRWVGALEALGLGTRLQRGRTYARNGQVLNLDITAGKIAAKVQGSEPKPYRIVIKLPVFTADQWNAAIDAMAGQAIFAAKLLADEMPQDIEEAFRHAGVPLFPQNAREMEFDCTCPDWNDVCKHIAAVLYLLGERFDEDPFLIFALRGRTREGIVEALRLRRAADVPDESEEEVTPIEPVPALTDLLDGYYTAGPELQNLRIVIKPPEVDAALIKRLGAPPAGTDVDLRVIYGAMSRWVLDKVYGDER